MQAYSIRFDGRVLLRGFWIYVIDIRSPQGRRLYVGRTGDSSSANAGSPFSRLGQHLDSRANAKGNALARNLRAAGIDPSGCVMEMIAIGPVFPEQREFGAHKPFRDQMAALERGLATALGLRGYTVLGSHGASEEPDPARLAEVLRLVDARLARLQSMARIDLSATIGRVTFQPEAWEWLDLLGDVLVGTQREAMAHDDFSADTPYKQLLVRAINRDISSLAAVYVLLRLEHIHQAASQIRLFCESLITLRYIAQDVATRVPQFLDYADVERYEVAQSALAWEAVRAKPAHVEQIRTLLSQLQPEYDRAKPRYMSTDRKGRKRPFVSWCNATVAEQARQCGIDRLYDLVYSQLSAYVHGSAWSLRRQIAYSRKHYDPRVVLVDIATVVRTVLVVWEEWAKFCDEQVGWALTPLLPSVSTRLDDLDVRHFPVLA